MGRPPIGERALTAAEKMRRYRARKFGNKPPVTRAKFGNTGAVTKSLDGEATLSMSAKDKLEAAIRQHKRRLDIEFEQRIQAETKERLESVQLPHHAKKLERMERLISARKGVMDKLTYNKIRRCLHPDPVLDPDLKKRHEEAFRLFNDLEKLLLSEKDSPTEFRPVPRTYEELMAAKARAEAERRTKRKAKSEISLR
jgi:hypothetical protein